MSNWRVQEQLLSPLQRCEAVEETKQKRENVKRENRGGRGLATHAWATTSANHNTLGAHVEYAVD